MLLNNRNTNLFHTIKRKLLLKKEKRCFLKKLINLELKRKQNLSKELILQKHLQIKCFKY